MFSVVAKDPTGKEINALAQHIQNITSPLTPFFFKTLYGLYREGADFVRGYPFSLREGVPTAVSHALWLNIPDYDAPTQLVKPLSWYLDAVMTIPKGTLFPMCGMNLTFNRELIGPALYFGLMGDGQSIGRYDMWAGWCIKVLKFPTNVPILFSCISFTKTSWRKMPTLNGWLCQHCNAVHNNMSMEDFYMHKSKCLLTLKKIREGGRVGQGARGGQGKRGSQGRRGGQRRRGGR